MLPKPEGRPPSAEYQFRAFCPPLCRPLNFVRLLKHVSTPSMQQLVTLPCIQVSNFESPLWYSIGRLGGATECHCDGMETEGKRWGVPVAAIWRRYIQ